MLEEDEDEGERRESESKRWPEGNYPAGWKEAQEALLSKETTQRECVYICIQEDRTKKKGPRDMVNSYIIAYI